LLRSVVPAPCQVGHGLSNLGEELDRTEVLSESGFDKAAIVDETVNNIVAATMSMWWTATANHPVLARILMNVVSIWCSRSGERWTGAHAGIGQGRPIRPLPLPALLPQVVAGTNDPRIAVPLAATPRGTRLALGAVDAIDVDTGRWGRLAA
jgi:hypothetical protein